MEILGIKSRFPQTEPLFCCETKNGDGCENYIEMEIPMHYIDTKLWIEGSNHNASWTRDIDLDAMWVISVTISDTVDSWGFLQV